MEEQRRDKVRVFRAENLKLGYGKRSILRQVDLVVNRGEFWFFLGPNGEGKSTFLKAVLGILKPQEGSLEFSADFSGRQVSGFVPQHCDLNPTLPTTVREFVLLGLVGLSCSAAEERERLRWALEKSGLEKLVHSNYWALSGGQRQRALVARALVRRPKLLIADEPTNGLDATSEMLLLHCLRNLNQQEEMTIIFVTHQLSLAARYATHAAIFHAAGVQSGCREKILNDENLSQIYDLSLADFRAAFGTVKI